MAAMRLLQTAHHLFGPLEVRIKADRRKVGSSASARMDGRLKPPLFSSPSPRYR
jgi:hypothetical protein